MSDTPIVPPVPPPPAPSPLDVAMAEQLAALTAAVTGLQQVAAKPAPAPAPPAPTPAAPVPDPLLEEFRQQQIENRNERRIACVRQMGYSGLLDDQQLLRLIPEADPRTPEGRAAFDNWRTANVRQFSAPGVTPESIVAGLTPAVDDAAVKSGSLFKTSDLVGSLFGTKRGK